MDGEDRISYLPRNVIDRIFKLLPTEDVARTSILSTSWRYNWATLPNLVLDHHFCNKLASISPHVFERTIDNILLGHVGNIVKFDLDMSRLHLSVCPGIDRWILHATANRVKKLKLNMPITLAYKVPSYIYDHPTLTKLKLFNCIAKLPKSFLGFQNLTTLYMENVTFEPSTDICVINAPLLVKLALLDCYGTRHLKFVSAGLKFLRYFEEEYSNLDLNCFMNCKQLIFLSLKVEYFSTLDERSTLEKLLLSLTALQELMLCSSALELLSAGVLPKRLPFTLNCLCSLHLQINFIQIGQTDYAFELLKNSPNLSKLEISVYHSFATVEAVPENIDTPIFLDQPLKKLEDVAVYYFKGSKIEVFFIKELLAHTPSLVRMSIEPYGSLEDSNIAIEMMQFHRASPKAELIYLENED